MARRVVITGMGIWSCLGTNIDEVRESLYNGKSGIGIDEHRKEYGYRSPLTGIVEKPQLKKLIDRHTRAGLPEEAEYAFMASKQAFEQAGVNSAYLDENEVGVIFGNDSSAKPVIEAAEIIKMVNHAIKLYTSHTIFRTFSTILSCFFTKAS